MSLLILIRQTLFTLNACVFVTQMPVYILSEVAITLLKQSLLLIYIPCLFNILYFCSKLLYSFPCLVLLAKNVKVFTRSYCSLKWAFAFRSGDLVQVLHDCRFPFKAQDALWPTGGLRLKWGVCFVCMCYETTIQRYFYRPRAELCIFIKALRITEMPSKWVCCEPVYPLVLGNAPAACGLTGGQHTPKDQLSLSLTL